MLDEDPGSDELESGEGKEETTENIELDAGLVEWQMTPDKLLRDLAHYLRSEKSEIGKKKGTIRWVKITDEEGKPLPPMLNEKGINYLLSELRPRVNKNTYMSIFSSDEIYETTRNLAINTTDALLLKHRSYAFSIKDYEDVVDKIADVVFAAYKWALDGSWQKKLSQSQTVRETVMAQNKNQPSAWDKIRKSIG